VSNKKIFLLGASLIISSLSPHFQAGTMSKTTVFGFSQSGIRGAIDAQMPKLLPDINIRAWSKWDLEGTKANDFKETTIMAYKQNNITLIGGITATVYFYDEAADSAEFRDMVTRDVDNELVPHQYIYDGAYRGNMANPKFRQYIINLAKLQIDAGVDGVFFDEVNAGYSGNTFDGNEGYDDYHLKDFNRYLAAKHPDFSAEQWFSVYKMDSSNFLDKNKPLDDIENNFNYREYLAKHGWKQYSSDNPLALVWGSITNNRPEQERTSFLEKYSTDIYWKEIVTATRDYARQKYSKEILITSNGIFPFVDFNSVGLYNYNVDDNGKEANYVPVNKQGHLDGSVSLGTVFRNLYKRNQKIAGDVPCVLFIDWPTDMMSNYYKLTASEKMDYWRIYAAEAYAYGLFFAFHLKTSISGDPTAKISGILDSLANYSAFYKSNRALFESCILTDTVPDVSSRNVTTTLISQTDSSRYLLHVVNHNYDSVIKPQYNVTFTVPCAQTVKRVRLFSPERKGPVNLAFQQTNNKISCTIDTLWYYSIIALESGNVPVVMHLPHVLKNTSENKSYFNLLGRSIPVEQKCMFRKKATVSSGIYIVNKKYIELVK
jgi:hypothetical protein